MDRLLAIRRHMMMAHVVSSATWQEYPVECWGIGNIYGGSYNGYRNLLYYKLPLLSSSIKIENSSGYNLALCFYDSSYSKVGSDQNATAGGVFTAPSGAAYFSAWAWDKPPFSIVDGGSLKMYYKGSPYVYPTAQSIMTGENYLWAVGNISNIGTFDNQVYQNQIVRTYQPMQTTTLDVDMSQMSYSLKISFFGSSYNFLADASFSPGQTYTDVTSGNTAYAYYLLTVWDRPSPADASSAPFVLTFR